MICNFAAVLRVSITKTKTSLALGGVLVAAFIFLGASSVTMAQPTAKVLYNLANYGGGGGLISDSAGNLYGTTEGLRRNYGTVFELRHYKNGHWAYKLLYKFTGAADGAYPSAPLAFDQAGNLYGTTHFGGINYCNWGKPLTCGVVFELSPTPKGRWTEKVVYNFPGGGGPAVPTTGLVSDKLGNFYGATATGGPRTFDGTVFELTPQPGGGWAEQQVYAFTSTLEGGMSVSFPLATDGSGNVYGVTESGGNGTSCASATGCGTLFELSPVPGGSWTYTLLYSFCSLSGCSDGGYPNGVVLDGQGNLYGTTGSGAVEYSAGGTAFELSPGAKGEWTFDLLYTFCSLPGCADGSRPFAAPTRDSFGNLYGSTGSGGNSRNGGTIYKLSPGPEGAWNFQSLYDFCVDWNCSDGFEPGSQLLLDTSGNLYGTTPVGGKGGGVIFEITQ
jgi:uncharacterized repeat protein (TIGR03803 family)